MYEYVSGVFKFLDGTLYNFSLSDRISRRGGGGLRWKIYKIRVSAIFDKLYATQHLYLVVHK